jgi:3,4-dihydroxy-2-butanone 4-phosphate synthase
MDAIKLTPEEAVARLRRGGFVLCMDLPETREFGCDIMMWQGMMTLSMLPEALQNYQLVICAILV